MNDVIPFLFQEQPVRVVLINTVPWWVECDVCTVLGYADSYSALDRLDEDEWQTIDSREFSQVDGVTSLPPVGLTKGTSHRIVVVNESGLYHLIFGSRKPEAQAFRRYVTMVILPEIQRKGNYGLPESTSEFQEAIRAQEFYLTGLAELRRKLADAMARQRKASEEVKDIKNAIERMNKQKDRNALSVVRSWNSARELL